MLKKVRSAGAERRRRTAGSLRSAAPAVGQRRVSGRGRGASGLAYGDITPYLDSGKAREYPSRHAGSPRSAAARLDGLRVVIVAASLLPRAALARRRSNPAFIPSAAVSSRCRWACRARRGSIAASARTKRSRISRCGCCASRAARRSPTSAPARATSRCRLARAVGRTGKVYAVDIQPGMLRPAAEQPGAREVTQRHAGARRGRRPEAASGASIWC